MNSSFTADFNFECDVCKFEDNCAYKDEMFAIDGAIDQFMRESSPLPVVAKIRIKVYCQKGRYQKEE